MSTVTEQSHQKLKTVDIAYIGLFSTLMMIGANITSFVPFMIVGGVPITLQTFFAILAGLILGSRKGALACTVYMCIGLAGAPVFARFGGGFSHLLSPTFGFIITFILAAFVAGLMVERSRYEEKLYSSRIHCNCYQLFSRYKLDVYCVQTMGQCARGFFL